MGWTVLYIAFGVVALWLLGEVLLQYKARLRWRLLAFGGFLTVVLGVLLPSVVVIAVGAIAFAVGQTYVTLSFRRGFSTGWSVGGRPGASRRRKAGAAAPEAGPTLEVSGLAYEQPPADPHGFPAPYGQDEAPHPPADPYAPTHGYAFEQPSAAETTAVYQPEPLPDETGRLYGVYGTAGGDRGQSAAEPQPPHQDPFAGYGTYPPPAAAPSYDYGSGSGDQGYAAYSDPYIGTSAAPGGQGYDNYGGYHTPQPPADPYGTDTPPGGVWVPQQREGDEQPPAHGYDPTYPHPHGDQQPYRY
ncbi:hypothetical protein [Streptomyces lichenis]|uniref:Integral membrane protein n=1 Tax=Streptomyces lichenis TaxID=2306967 RepID=A0ABT0IEA0_9ACTN|nr:hypothetical protein [Streptomyces lichenis]MCK8679659.1 hypothetical protein [Streptomyces lichenis]